MRYRQLNILITHYMKHKFIITTIISFLFSLGLVAQTQVAISGVVVDSKSDEPLVGAAILEKGTENGVTTDFNGEFMIKVRQGATLEISYLGYDSQTMVAGSTNSTLQIKLVEKTRELDEVVVIGYGVQRKSDITGSISSIAGEDISSLPYHLPCKPCKESSRGSDCSEYGISGS